MNGRGQNQIFDELLTGGVPNVFHLSGPLVINRLLIQHYTL